MKNEIAKLVFALSEYYDKPLTQLQFDMYVEDLQELSVEDLIKAIKLYRQDPANDRFPIPSKLIGLLKPSDEDQAREVLGRIRSAISNIGPYRTGEAKEFVGEIAWEVIKRQGGWEEVCKASYDQLPAFQANWRDTAKTVMKRDRLGLKDEAPRFERKQLTSIGEIIALIPNKDS
jgi:hypothetical protein